MQTYLYIHRENTSGPQDRYRGKYPLKHVDYELSRAVGRKGDVVSDVQGGKIRVVVDMLCFSPQAREYGYNRLSETVLYGTLDKANAIADNLGLSLVKNAGKTRVGSNFYVYAENPSGRVFRGNQHVTTHGLKDIGKSITKYTQPKIGRLAMPLAVAIEGVEVYDGLQQDGGTIGHNTVKETIGGASNLLAGSVVGVAAGATARLTIGAIVAKSAAIGSLAGPIGTIAGILVGAVVGYYVGEAVENSVEDLYDSSFKN